MSANKSLRNKLDDFFSPGPTAKSKSAVKLSRDIEDSEDIYNHTKQFFKQGDAADAVDVGERKIRGEIDLDDLVYGGKKVTRRDLEEESEEEEIESDEEMESGVEEGSEEEEEEDKEENNGEDADIDMALKQLKEEEKEESKFI